jgi:RHS repeat-associated protein
LRARYYDSTTGRFTQEDPIRDGYNWYSYCGGNPVGFMKKTKNIQNTKNFLFERILE